MSLTKFKEPITYDQYHLATENLKREGDIMRPDSRLFGSKAFLLFKTFFENPKVWFNSRNLSDKTGVGVSSITSLLKRAIPYLKREGLLEEKEEPGERGMYWRFLGTSDNPVEEARLWYRKMFEVTPGIPRRKGASVVPAVKAPQAPAVPPVRGNGLVQVNIDPSTMEAVIRVPYDQLPTALALIQRKVAV